MDTFAEASSISLEQLSALLARALDLGSLSGRTLFLKPNLTYPFHKPGVTTRPELIQLAIRCLRDAGARVFVGESDGGYRGWPADTAFRGHDLPRICRENGATLVNLSKEPRTPVTHTGRNGRTVEFTLPGILVDGVELFVTMPVPKVHAVTLYSGAVKNQWGCIPDTMRLALHPYFDEAIWTINRLVRPRLVIGDGEYMLDRSGPMAGDPRYVGRVLVSGDVAAFDTAVSRAMGLRVQDITYLRPRQVAAARLIDALQMPWPRFSRRLSHKDRVVGYGFRRPWAVRLIWTSALGDALHAVWYAARGNPIKRDRRAVEQVTHPTRAE